MAIDTREETEQQGRTAADTVRSAGAATRDALQDTAAAVPPALAEGREAIDRLARRLESEPDLNLVAAMALSVGASVGLLVGGAPRAVVIAGMLPAVAVGFVLLGRAQPTR